MIKKITLITLLTIGFSYGVESESAKHTQNCVGKQTDCPQMTYHFLDDDDTVYLYQDVAGYWYIYGSNAHDLDKSQLASLLKNAHTQQNQSDLSQRNKFNELLF